MVRVIEEDCSVALLDTFSVSLEKESGKDLPPVQLAWKQYVQSPEVGTAVTGVTCFEPVRLIGFTKSNSAEVSAQ